MNNKMKGGMNMEMLIGGLIVGSAMYGAWKINKIDDDKTKIKSTFINLNYKIKEQAPQLIYTHTNETATTYTYSVPYGLVDDPKLQVLEKVLNKPVKVSFANQKLHIKVYKQKLKERYSYNLFPSMGDWTIPVGMSLDGVVYHDFDVIPHMTVAGSTTWGKTMFMRMLMTHLIENNPDGVEFYILDLKGKLAFNKYRNLKQVKIVAGDYKESYQALSMVKKDIQRDMKYLLSIGAENAKEGNIPTRKFIIVDEAGELVPNKNMSDEDKVYTKNCQRILSYIARVAGQIGYKLIFGTQYPTAEVLHNQIKANATAKISFRLSTGIQSGVALDGPGAEKLEYPGRAIYKVTDEYIVQTPFITKKEIWERIGRYENVGSAAKKNTTPRKDIIEFG